MKILIYSLGLPPFRRGGLTNYTIDLAAQLVKNGNQVDFLYPGKMPLYNKEKIKIKRVKSSYKFNCYELINPLPVSLTFGNSVNTKDFFASRDKNTIRNYIQKMAPDIVHIHTIMGLPIEFVEVLKEENIRTIFTTHDYYGLCPKMLTSNPMKELKSSKCSYDCMLCKVGPNINKIKIMQSHFYQHFKNSRIITAIRKMQSKKIASNLSVYYFTPEQVEERYQLRQYYLRLFSLIDYYHFNSSVAQAVFKKYLPEIKGTVVPLTISGLRRNHTVKKSGKKVVTIGFLGGTAAKKGFLLFVQVAEQLNQAGLRFKIICAGSNSRHPFFDNSYVTNLGIISHEQIDQFYSRIDMLVVPSLWHETFGLVVLEAITQNIPVICSDMVGAKDLLPPDLIFHNKDEFKSKLAEFIQSVYRQEQIVNEIQHLEVNVDFNQHVKKLQQIFYWS